MTGPPQPTMSLDRIEAVYSDSPYIAEVGVFREDDRFVGLIVPDFEALREGGTGQLGYLLSVTLTGLGLRLPPEQRLSAYRFVRGPLSHTASGIPCRDQPTHHDGGRSGNSDVLRVECWLTADQALLKSENCRRVWEWLQLRFPNQALLPSTCPQIELQIDSLDWIKLALEVEEATGVALSETALGKVYTLRDLLHEVASLDDESGVTGAGAYAGFSSKALTTAQRYWLQPHTSFELSVWFLLYSLNRWICRACFDVRTEGIEYLPDEGPFVLAFNHASDLDPFVVAAGLDWALIRNCFWAGENRRLFANRALRLFSRIGGVFPVNDRVAGSTVASGCAAIEQGGILVWFPEGWRTPDGQLLPFARGVGAVLQHTGTPVVPGYIVGTFEAMPRWQSWPRRGPVRILFGPPLSSAELEARGRGANSYARIVDSLRTEVQRLADRARQATGAE
jgi:long-chain acyl-CoA synthetase